MDIIIIDDEAKMGQIIRRALNRTGLDAEATTDPKEGLDWLRDHPARMILCDLKMPTMSGLEVLAAARSIRPDVGFIIMTAFASAETAVAAMKNGAYDYIIKPFAMDELKTLVTRYLKGRKLEAENAALRALVDEHFQFDHIIAASQAMQDVLAVVRKVARSDVSVMIRGESGSGKEVLAGAIHNNGPRRDKPLIKVNCAALPDNLLESELFGHVAGSFTGATQTRAGLFEAADGGAIFLDEIGDVSPSLQVRLLRVLQEGEFMRVGDTTPFRVDVRIIAATHRDLEAAMREGAFRSDLFYRLNVVPIQIPPLRERRADLPPLIELFLKRFAREGQVFELTPAARDHLLAYDWPGNVRELENALEHASVMADGTLIDLDDLPLAVRNNRPPEDSGLTPSGGQSVGQMTLEEIEKQCLIQAMDQAGHNHTKAAQILGITRRTLGYRLKKYGLKE